MKYLVMVRYLPKGKTQWETIEREFADEAQADEYAKMMYDREAAEISVSIYQMIKNYH